MALLMIVYFVFFNMVLDTVHLATLMLLSTDPSVFLSFPLTSCPYLTILTDGWTHALLNDHDACQPLYDILVDSVD